MAMRRAMISAKPILGVILPGLGIVDLGILFSRTRILSGCWKASFGRQVIYRGSIGVFIAG